MASAFGEELRRLRGDRTQLDVATAAGITQAFLSDLETGRRERFGADVLYALCRSLGVSPDHFARFFPAPPATDAEPAERPMGKRK